MLDIMYVLMAWKVISGKKINEQTLSKQEVEIQSTYENLFLKIKYSKSKKKKKSFLKVKFYVFHLSSFFPAGKLIKNLYFLRFILK